MIPECIDFVAIDGWLDELEDARRRRILANRPDIDNAKLKSMVTVDDVADDKYRMILIGSVVEFAVENKTGLIYHVSKGVIKRKMVYGRLMDWHEWDWQGFYPCRKHAFVWDYGEYKGDEDGKNGEGESGKGEDDGSI